MTHHTPFVCQIKIFGILRTTEDDVDFIVTCDVVRYYDDMMDYFFEKLKLLLIGCNLNQTGESGNL